MKEQNDDIFNHFKNVLRNHEEPYNEGAWEHFAAKSGTAAKKSPVIAMWKWAVAAAVIAGVVILAGVFSADRDNSINNPVAMDAPEDHKTGDSNAPAGDHTIAAIDEKEGHPSFDEKSRVVDVPHDSRAAVVLPPSSNKTTALQTGLIAPDPVTAPYVQPQQQEIANVPVVKEQQAQKPQVDFWRNKVVEDTKQQQKPVLQDNNRIILASTPDPAAKRKHSEKNRRWQPGVFISPLFGDLGVNMGYGVSLGYAINDKVKISSGIAHTKITASRSYEATASSVPSGAIMADKPLGLPDAHSASGSLKSANKVMASNSYVTGPQQVTTLQEIEGSLSGIDIPVEVNYNFGKKLYAAAGVSGLVVINDNRKYTYLDNRNEKVSVQSNNGSLKEDRAVMFSEKSITSQPVEAQDDNVPFLGFYNLSVGFRQKISGRNSVSLEPFIKLPVKGATRQNLNYKGSGIRLKFDF
ncbi:MAG TPA: hypothetical protein PKE30_12425 [Niabella sp.]|nr:hypothetical protein [Niabella sp.]